MKKFLSALMILSLLCWNILPAFADEVPVNAQCGCNACPVEQITATERLSINKKAPVNTVKITNYRKIICRNNVLGIEYICRFSSKKACSGDRVDFIIPENIYSCEGRLIIPACTKIVAEVAGIQQPKWFNKNARVSMNFKYLILPDGRTVSLCARPFTKDGTLKEGPWMTAGSIVLCTVTGGILGAGAGIGFGFIPSPTKLGVGLAAGIPAGCGIGLITALVTKGLQYKAKPGEQIYIILGCDTCIPD